MSTCAAILATIVALVVILIAYLWVKVTSARRKAKAALKGWAAIHSPDCIKSLSPPVCAALLSDPGPPPDPARPRVPGFDAAAATYAAKVVSRFIAYLGPAGSPALLQLGGMGPPAFASIAQDQQPLAATWVAAGGAAAVVAVRGTQTVADLMSDLEYGETTATDSRIKVHQGMIKVYLEARAALFAALPSTVKTLFITGHSLGAAVAFYYAYDAAQAGLTVEVVGLAPPRAGNQAFAAALAATARTASLINLADLIPTMPWSFMPDRKAPYTPDEYAAVAPVAVFNNLKSDIASCHGIPAYYEGIAAGPVVIPAV